MLSDMAIEDLNDFIDLGLRPRPSDVVRLNSLGLRVQFTRDGSDLGILPRVAILGERVRFREPTIGHEIWMQDVDHVFNLDKPETLLTVRAFCLSRDQAKLPDPADLPACVKAVDEFRRYGLAEFTVSQIAAAVVYAESGNYAGVREYPAARSENGEKTVEQPGDKCFDVGVLYNGVLVGLGSVSELRGMPASHLRSLVREKIRRDEQFGSYTKQWNDDAMADYLRTKDEILARLKKEAGLNG